MAASARSAAAAAARASAEEARRQQRRASSATAAASSRAAAAAAETKLPAASLGDAIRHQFPVLSQSVGGRPLVYLDSAATSQKPTQVLDTLSTYYSEYNSNVHRGVHALSARATAAYEDARDKVARFIGAASPTEVVFTRNASEAINLVAYSWGMHTLRAGDEIVLSVLEHHSNLVPWQMVAQRTGAVLRFAELGPGGAAPDVDSYRAVVGPRTRLIATAHVSNTLGCVAPVAELVEMARGVGARVMLDACQSVPHMPVDVRALGVDWIVASGHKMCGPTGIGFLWGRAELLAEMPPWMGGGEMIRDVFLDRSTYADPPSRFEAGTPAIGEAIGLGAACDYLSALGMARVAEYEHELAGYLYERLAAVPGVRIYGPPPSAPRGRAALAAFNVDGLHATDVSTILDQAGVAVRSGHHCTQPLHRALGIPASARASLYIYNTRAEVDAFVDALRDTVRFFAEVNGAAA